MTSSARIPAVVEFAPGVVRRGSAITKVTPALRIRPPRLVLRAPVPPPVPPPRFQRPSWATQPVPRSEAPTVRVPLATIEARARALRDRRPWLVPAALRVLETFVATMLALAAMLAWTGGRGFGERGPRPAPIVAPAPRSVVIVPLDGESAVARDRTSVIIRVHAHRHTQGTPARRR
jgi:hypothetical protein